MKHLTSALALSIGCLLVPSFDRIAFAGYVATAMTASNAYNGDLTNPYYTNNSTQSGQTSASASSTSNLNLMPPATASATASASIENPTSSLYLKTAANAGSPSDPYNYTAASATASWSDSIHLTGSPTASTLYGNLKFQVDGTIQLGSTLPMAMQGDSAGGFIVIVGDPYTNYTQGSIGITAAGNDILNVVILGDNSGINNYGPLSHVVVTPLGSGSFGVTADISVPVALTLNGSGYTGTWQLQTTSKAGAEDAYSIVDFSHTVVLTSFTLSDGHTPQQDGYAVTFGSGAQVGAVPEPSSLALICLGFPLGCLVQKSAKRLGSSPARRRSKA